jgi:hypothetical protein
LAKTDAPAVFATLIAVTEQKQPLDHRVLWAAALCVLGTVTIRLG